jgi:hypothetical protein
MYVFDTSPFSALFKSFYRSRFPTLWTKFDDLIGDRTIISTREVFPELDRYGNADYKAWLCDNRDVFTTPSATEAQFIQGIYRIRHFQQNIEMKKSRRAD